MNNFKKTAIVTLLAGLGFTGSSQAALNARAGGMVYDDVSNLTWSADANLFKAQADSNLNLVSGIIATNGGVIYDTPNAYMGYTGTHNLTIADFYTDTGQMSWYGAQAWVNSLTLGGVSGWNLPTTYTAKNSYYDNIQVAYNGQLPYLLNQLMVQGEWSIFREKNTNYDLFTNIGYPATWSSTEYHPVPEYAWLFHSLDGGFRYNGKGVLYSAWAVHSGDVAAVSVPGAAWLFGSGLIGLVSFNRKKIK